MPGTLLLIPTPGEKRVLDLRLSQLCGEFFQMELCGFGPVASGARTAQCIRSFEPERVILAGIAGALSPDLDIGRAAVFEDVAMYGVGAGSGDTFRNAGELGWPHWSGPTDHSEHLRIEDRLRLSADPDGPPGRLLLTVCASSATRKDVRDRLDCFPDAMAEDMESFSVAVACALAGVPLTIVRGISNIAGDRDKVRWRIADALHAAADTVLEVLG